MATTATGEERSIWTVVGRASAVVGLLGGVAGLLFLLVPELQPKPDPPVRKASFAELQVEPGLTRRQYLQRVDLDPGGLDAKTLAQRGAFLEFDVQATGYRGKPLALKLELVNASGDEVGQEQSTTIRPAADEDAIAWQAFLVYPPAAKGSFVARMELFDPDGDRIARKRSEPFSPPPAT
jgi:hypothetical protein